MGDEPDCDATSDKAEGSEWGGQSLVKELEDNRNEGGEQSSESGGKAHCPHGQRAIEDGEG